MGLLSWQEQAETSLILFFFPLAIFCFSFFPAFFSSFFVYFLFLGISGLMSSFWTIPLVLHFLLLLLPLLPYIPISLYTSEEKKIPAA